MNLQIYGVNAGHVGEGFSHAAALQLAVIRPCLLLALELSFNRPAVIKLTLQSQHTHLMLLPESNTSL